MTAIGLSCLYSSSLNRIGSTDGTMFYKDGLYMVVKKLILFSLEMSHFYCFKHSTWFPLIFLCWFGENINISNMTGIGRRSAFPFQHFLLFNTETACRVLTRFLLALYEIDQHNIFCSQSVTNLISNNSVQCRLRNYPVSII